MDSCTIWGFYGTTIIVVFIMAALKFKNQWQKHNYDLRLEKEHNQHEIIMYYLRKTDAKTLQKAVAEIMDKKFSDKQQDIDAKMKEIEQKVRDLNALIGHVKTKEEPKVD